VIPGIALVAVLAACGSGSSTGTAKAPAGAKENATTGVQCIPNVLGGTPTSTCAVDMVGPGGGLVFYAKDGRFLEVAPSNWNPAFGGGGGKPCESGGCRVAEYSRLLRVPSGQTQDYGTGGGLGLCSDSTGLATSFWGFPSYKPSLGTAIGSGRANTAALLADSTCTGGAVRLVANYRGGGLDDWFLPSKDELDELFKFGDRAAAGGFVGNLSGVVGYVSSSVVNPSDRGAGFVGTGVWKQRFDSGSTEAVNVLDNQGAWLTPFAVRPIREFTVG